MEDTQPHKFVDLAKPVKQPKESGGMSRRDFLATTTLFNGQDETRHN
jgi:hypothetical protein